MNPPRRQKDIPLCRASSSEKKTRRATGPKRKDPLQYNEAALLAYLKRGQMEVDQFMEKYLFHKRKEEDGCLLFEAMRYALFSGGKRFRPNLCLAAAESVSNGSSRIPREALLPFACAMELIHAYSLVHDDLPAMDNESLRRGKPTHHKIYGEGTAILVGDALLTLAFTLMAEQALLPLVHPQTVLEIIVELGTAAGMNGMVLGQCMDLQSQTKEQIEATFLQSMHRYKTGALIAASVRIGGILGQATPDALQQLGEYGDRVGLAFQIMDDLLDVSGEEKELGKTVGQDQKRGKWTYPRLVGFQQAQEEAYHLAVSAREALASFGSAADPLRWIASHTVRRRH